ncbi:GGDEF domain-containing protein [Marinobacter caseinilyticus]|uniref:GGDEF domain-containing protein n=1 Tax=Marinobacter caseinilyticus TaxID=2692195 RepID=UPI00140B8604|nr:diguanylate cyclase [Marinobacter caseinilyticus]
MDTRLETVTRLAQPHRRAILVALLWLTVAAGLLFAVLNLIYGSAILAMAELLMVVYAGALLLVVQVTQYIERWIVAFVLPFFCVMMFALTVPRASASIFAWVLVIPVLSHLLLGRRQGLIIALLFLTIAAVIFFIKHGDNPELMQALPIANIVLISLCILSFSHVYEMSREKSELTLLRMAQTDFLTGLANRARFKDSFEREKQRALRENQPMSLLVIDLDYFKSVNDRFGHETGDKALVYVADLLTRRLRATDQVCRLGGEEFGVILVDTNAELAAQVAEHMRHSLETEPFILGGQTIALTMSIGLAEFRHDGDSLRSLLGAADQRLYQGKAQGRNQVIGRVSEADDSSLNTSAIVG